MARPGYTTNMTLLDGADTDTGYGEPSASGWTSFFASSFSETDLFIHGAASISGTVKTGVGSLMFDNSSGITLGTDDAVLIWMYYGTPNSLDTEANGGIRQIIAATAANFDYVVHGGNDTYIYGGWLNLAMGSPASISTTSVGSGTGTTYQHHGWAFNAVSVPSKGNPYLVDAMRYGRCDLEVIDGDATDGYGIFKEMAAANDANDVSFTCDTVNTDATITNVVPNTDDLYPGLAISGTGITGGTLIRSIISSTSAEMSAVATATNTDEAITAAPFNRWGLFQKQSGSTYLSKGLITLGTSGTAVDFRDANSTIQIDNTKNVTALFNAIEINNASSRVDWTGVTFGALGTVSPGTFAMIDAADVNFQTCSFSDMGFFDFQSTADVLDCAFIRCGLIDALGATFNGSSVLTPTISANTSGLIWNVDTDPTGLLDNMTFTKTSGLAHHAIEFGTAISDAASFTLNDCVFGTDFSGTEDGSVGDETFHFLDTTGSITLNLVDCTGNFGYRTEGVAVSIVIDPVATKVTVQNEAGDLLQNARVFLETADDGGTGFPFEDAVTTLTQSGGTAELTSTGVHGLDTGDKVVIRGAQADNYNRTVTITVTSTTVFTYSVNDNPTSPATGTPVYSYVPVQGLTDVNGEITASKTWPASQSLTGWARLATGVAPFYKQGVITVNDASGGTDLLITLLDDE
jgi:hypothetical protein